MHGIEMGRLLGYRTGSYIYETQNPDSFWSQVVLDAVVATFIAMFTIFMAVKAWKKGAFRKDD